MDTHSPDLKNLLRKRIRQQGYSLSEFIRKTDLSRSYLYNLMAGKVADPGVKTLYKLSAALNMPSVAMFRLFSENAEASPREEYEAIGNSSDRCMVAGGVHCPDYSMVLPGETFTKIWVLQNAGSVSWKGRRLRRVDNEVVMSVRDNNGFLQELASSQLRCAKAFIPIPDTAPGETVDLTVEFFAPQEHVSVASIWRVEDAQGKQIYPRGFCLKTIVTVVAD
jgi:transcriptional regulator with XRE-family HTH domain